MIFHDKNTWRYGSRFSNINIPQNKVFNKLFSQNNKECYRFKKNHQKMNGHRTLKDTEGTLDVQERIETQRGRCSKKGTGQ